MRTNICVCAALLVLIAFQGPWGQAQNMSHSAVANLAPTIDRILDDLIDAMVAKGEADFVNDFAARLVRATRPRRSWRASPTAIRRRF